MIFAPKKSIVQIEVRGQIAWQVTRDPDSGMWVAVCQALKLNALGETFEELTQAVTEAMQLLFTELFEHGEFEAFLRARGWKPLGELPTPGSRVQFDAPFSLTPNGVSELMAATA